MATPRPVKIVPDNGDPGDRFTATITGDVLTGSEKCDIAPGIDCQKPYVIDDGTITVKITISPKAAKGLRDVIVTNNASDRGTLKDGFTVN